MLKKRREEATVKAKIIEEIIIFVFEEGKGS